MNTSLKPEGTAAVEPAEDAVALRGGIDWSEIDDRAGGMTRLGVGGGETIGDGVGDGEDVGAGDEDGVGAGVACGVGTRRMAASAAG